MQTGTVPVERLWAGFEDYFPKASRSMGLEWWMLIASLCFLRYNYRHYHHKGLPGWMEGDCLLAERIDWLTSLTRQLYEKNAEDAGVSGALAEVFGNA
eukprot:8332747-Karenia_brevis.AAC.1